MDSICSYDLLRISSCIVSVATQLSNFMTKIFLDSRCSFHVSFKKMDVLSSWFFVKTLKHAILKAWYDSESRLEHATPSTQNNCSRRNVSRLLMLSCDTSSNSFLHTNSWLCVVIINNIENTRANYAEFLTGNRTQTMMPCIIAAPCQNNTCVVTPDDSTIALLLIHVRT